MTDTEALAQELGKTIHCIGQRCGPDRRKAAARLREQEQQIAEKDRILNIAYEAMGKALRRCQIKIEEMFDEHESRTLLRLAVFGELDIPLAQVGSEVRSAQRRAALAAHPAEQPAVEAPDGQ